jgi:phosphatidylglycerol:prolipoprotein diacylglycerol transferase
MIGKITDVPWAVVFPRADMAPRHPVQLYQALCEGPILAGILLYSMRFDLRPGQRGSLFLMSYGVLRLVTEAFREVDADYLGLWHGLTSAQLLSFAMILAGALIFLFLAAVSRGGVVSCARAFVSARHHEQMLSRA